MSNLSAGKIQVDNLTVAGLGAGAIQATNLKFNNLDVSGNLTVQGAQVATQAFVTAADALKANLASPSFTGTVTVSGNESISGNLDVSGNFIMGKGSFSIDTVASKPFINVSAPLNLKNEYLKLRENSKLTRNMDDTAKLGMYGFTKGGCRITFYSCYDPLTRQDIIDYNANNPDASGYVLTNDFQGKNYSSTLNTEAYHNKFWQAMKSENADVYLCAGDFIYADILPDCSPVSKVNNSTVIGDVGLNTYSTINAIGLSFDPLKIYNQDPSGYWVSQPFGPSYPNWTGEVIWNKIINSQKLKLNKVVKYMSDAGFVNRDSSFNITSYNTNFYMGVDDHEWTRDKTFGIFPVLNKTQMRDQYIRQLKLDSIIPEYKNLTPTTNRGFWYTKTFPINIDITRTGILRLITVDNTWDYNSYIYKTFSDEQWNWIDSTLNDAQNDDFVLFMIGSPTIGSSDLYSADRLRIYSLISKYRIEKCLILTGDQHISHISVEREKGWIPYYQIMSSGATSAAFNQTNSLTPFNTTTSPPGGRYCTIDIDYYSAMVNVTMCLVPADISADVQRCLVATIPFAELSAKSYIKNKTIKTLDDSGNVINTVIPYPVDTKDPEIVNNLVSSLSIKIECNTAGISSQRITDAVLVINSIEYALKVSKQFGYTVFNLPKSTLVSLQNALGLSNTTNSDGNKTIDVKFRVTIDALKTELKNTYTVVGNVQNLLLLDLYNELPQSSAVYSNNLVYSSFKNAYANSLLTKMTSGDFKVIKVPTTTSNRMVRTNDITYPLTSAYATSTRSLTAFNSFDSSGIYYYRPSSATSFNTYLYMILNTPITVNTNPGSFAIIDFDVAALQTGGVSNNGAFSSSIVDSSSCALDASNNFINTLLNSTNYRPIVGTGIYTATYFANSVPTAYDNNVSPPLFRNDLFNIPDVTQIHDNIIDNNYHPFNIFSRLYNGQVLEQKLVEKGKDYDTSGNGYPTIKFAHVLVGESRTCHFMMKQQGQEWITLQTLDWKANAPLNITMIGFWFNVSYVVGNVRQYVNNV